MPLNLNDQEARIIGCLMEKSVITPDQYPLTLNALTNACNQKSSREPIMALEKGMVQRTARHLHAKKLIRVDENFKTGVEKYSHRFCNEPLSEYQFDPAQFALITLLLLRGAQTPGELRAHSGRLYTFTDNASVVDALNGLIERDGPPVIAKLPRTPGRKDAEYMHLLSGPIDAESLAGAEAAATSGDKPGSISLSDLAQRVSQLEAEVAELKERLTNK